jgi:hypothetical protein
VGIKNPTPGAQEQPQQSLRAGLMAYREANNLPPDGGVSERWASVRVGGVPVAYPNIAARRAAVPYHDLNHVVSGYATDLRGEGEIGAWEVGSGCGSLWFAWVIDLAAMVAGLRWPVRTLRAFARGRQTGNLFGAPYDVSLDRSVSDLRSELGLDRPIRMRLTDVGLFVALLPLGAVSGAALLAFSVVTAPWWLREGVHRRRREPAPSSASN